MICIFFRRIILQETYSIEDCTYYNPNSITSKTSVDISLPNGDFLISFKIKRQSSSGNASYVHLSNGTSDTALIGQTGGGGNVETWLYYSSTPTTHRVGQVPLDTEALVTLKHEGTTDTFSLSTASAVDTFSDTLTHSKLNYIDVQKIRILK